MSVLSFAKPKKTQSVEDWKNISADGAPPGVYISNMSEEDKKKWKAKVVGSQSLNFQIEIRSEKTGSNLLAIVNGKMPTKSEAIDESKPRWGHPKDPVPHEIKLSANGPMLFSREAWDEFQKAVAEARLVLKLLDEEESRADTLKLVRAGQSPTI